MVHVDGSQGEGGGQVLRSALTLALITGQAMRITNIRARRREPGLKAQHLAAVQAAAAISGANVEGATQGSAVLTFQPGSLRPGRYQFDIGTAGATTLVLQTVFLPLSRAGGVSSITLTGGTHVPWSPCFHYLTLHWLPYLRQIGYDADLELEQAGFYPKGGGRVHATIRPAQALSPLRLVERGGLRQIRGLSAVANLDVSIAERQRRQALQRLHSYGLPAEIEIVRLPSPVQGTLLLLLAEFEQARCCYYALGERGKPAERVADEAVNAFETFLATDAAIDQYLADQLLLPLALASGVSVLRTARVTEHLITNAAVIRLFLPATIEIQGEIGRPGLVHIAPPAGASIPRGMGK